MNNNVDSIIPDVMGLAINLTKDCDTDKCRASNIAFFVVTNIKYNIVNNDSVGHEQVEFNDSLLHGGDCRTFSIVFAAMARAVNLTAKVVSTRSHSIVLIELNGTNYLVEPQGAIFKETIISEYLI